MLNDRQEGFVTVLASEDGQNFYRVIPENVDGIENFIEGNVNETKITVPVEGEDAFTNWDALKRVCDWRFLTARRAPQ